MILDGIHFKEAIVDKKQGTHWKNVKEEDKKPLEWEEHNSFEAQQVRVVIQKAVGFRGKILYSFFTERLPGKEGQRASKYFRPEDGPALVACINKAIEYLQNPVHA